MYFNLGDNEIEDSHVAVVLFLALLGVVSPVVAGSFPTGEDALEIYLFLSLGLFGGLFIFYYGFVKRKELRLIQDTPTSKIQSMAMGTVEVKGEARKTGEGCLEAPFSGEDCILYRYEVEEYRQQGKNSSWVTVASGREDARFELDDGTGTVTVDSEGADLEIPEDNVFRHNSWESTPAEIKQFIEQRSGDPGGLIGDNDRKYREWFVTPGEELYVFGYASTESVAEGEVPVIKSDDRQEMFMISDSSEKKLLDRKGTNSVLMIAGGALLALGCYGGLLLMCGVL